MKESVKSSLISLLMEKLPELRFDEDSFKRNMRACKFNEQPYWTGLAIGWDDYGNKVFFHFDGRDTMKEISKRGVDLLHDNHLRYEVFAK